MGQSPIHNQNTALVLNRFTGHVSPQFHVTFDKGFYSTKQERLTSLWQAKTHFVTASEGGNSRKQFITASEGGNSQKWKGRSDHNPTAPKHPILPEELTVPHEEPNETDGPQPEVPTGNQVPPEEPPIDPPCEGQASAPNAQDRSSTQPAVNPAGDNVGTQFEPRERVLRTRSCRIV